MKHLISIVYILCFFDLTGQVTYYVDATLGCDNNNGISILSPWKTVNKINSYSFQPGDKILFKRGEVWKGQSLNFTSSGEENNPIIIGAYGFSIEKPIISGVSQVNSQWQQCFECNDNIWETNAENPGRLFLGASKTEILSAYDFNNLGNYTYSKKNCSTALSIDKWYWNRDNGKLYIHSTINPNNLQIYRSRQSDSRYYNITIENQHNLIIENINFQGGVVGFLIGSNTSLLNQYVSSYNIIIRNCEIGNFSSGAISLKRVNNIKIYNNIFDSKYSFKYGLTLTDCNETGVVLDSDARKNDDAIEISRYGKNCEIYGNEFINWSHSSVQLKCVESIDEGDCYGVNNNKIYNNYIHAEDISYSRAFGLQGIANGVFANEIYSNLVKNTTIRSQIAGENNFIHHNIFDGITQSDVRPKGYAQAINVNNHQPSYVASNNKFDNNLFLSCEDEALSIENNYLNRNAIENNYFRNNIIFNCGILNSYYGITIVEGNGSKIKNNTYNNNLIYNEKNGNQIESKINYYGEEIIVLTFNGYNDNGNNIENNISQNPNFINLSQSYNINVTSPCYESGDINLNNENYNEDFYGILFPNQNPEIGHEEISPNRTKVKDEYCDILLPLTNGIIECYPLPNIHHYKFKFTNTENLNDIYYYNTLDENTTVNLYGRTWIKPKKTYTITVRALLNEEETEGYSPGTSCNITIPHLTKLKDQYCDNTIPLNNGILECYPLPNIHHYKFKFTNTEDLNEIYYYNTLDEGTTFNLYERSWVKSNTTYTVEVRALLNEEETEGFSFGEPCYIMTESIQNGFSKKSSKENTKNIMVYPNSFKNGIIYLTEKIKIDNYKLFNSTGKILINNNNNAYTNKLYFDEFLPNGIYFLKINYNNKELIFKIIKN